MMYDYSPGVLVAGFATRNQLQTWIVQVITTIMSKKDKLLKRFLSAPADFSYDELVRLMKGFGYDESQAGKTSGSAVSFIHFGTRHIIKLHKPHPNPVLKGYQIKDVIDELKRKEIIK